MPFIITYFDTNDQEADNANALRLADHFRMLSKPTQGELTLHADPESISPRERGALNGIIIEYQSKDPNRSTERLGATVTSIINGFAKTTLVGPIIKQLEDLEHEAVKLVAPEAKLAL